MEILSPLSTTSNAQTAFTIYPGKQITLRAKGLAGDDKVFVEILELSKAPEATGNPCCTFYQTDIQVLGRTPLLCPNGKPVELTADFPVGTMDAPQSVTLGVRVEADPAAVVTVELHETESDGCLACICDRPVEAGVSQIEIVAWPDITLAPLEIASIPDLNIASIPELTITSLPELQVEPLDIASIPDLTIASLPELQVEPLDIASIPDLTIASLPELQVEPLDIATLPELVLAKHVVSSEIHNGVLYYIWSDGTKTEETLPVETVFCPSIRFKDGGFGFHVADPKDPAATVEIADCDGVQDSAWIYPTAGPGHTVRKTDCDGNFIGYAANTSTCAPDCGYPETTVNVAAPKVTVVPVNNFAPVNNFSPTTNVAAPNVTLPAPNVVGASFSQDGELTITRSDATEITAQIPTCN